MIIQVKHCHPLTNKLERIYDDFYRRSCAAVEAWTFKQWDQVISTVDGKITYKNSCAEKIRVSGICQSPNGTSLKRTSLNWKGTKTSGWEGIKDTVGQMWLVYIYS